MPRPKGSKNKPKTDAKGNLLVKPAKIKKVAAKKPAPAMKKAKTVKKAQPEVKVNAPKLEPETPAAVGPRTLAAAGKNVGEAIIRPVDDDENDGNTNTVVMEGGRPTLRKSKSNPDLD